MKTPVTMHPLAHPDHSGARPARRAGAGQSPAAASRSRSRFARAAVTAATAATTALLLAGCAGGGAEGGDNLDASGAPLQGAMVEPVASPQSGASASTSGDLAGTTGRLDGVSEVSAVAQPGGATARAGVRAAVLSPGSLHLVSTEGSAAPTTASVPVDSSCRSVSRADDGVMLACDGLLLHVTGPADSPRIAEFRGDGSFTTATMTNEGRIVAAKQGSDRAFFYTPSDAAGGDLHEDTSAVISRSIDHAELVTPAQGAQRVALIDRAQTSITDVDVVDGSRNAALRIGTSVGQARASSAEGGSAGGVVVASDPKSGQVLIYTMNDVVRLHQMAPVTGSPWATTWDAARQRAWVSTTDNTLLTAYSIDSGVPQATAQTRTIGDVRAILVDDAGSLLLLGADGSFQLLDAASVDRLTAPAGTSLEYPVTVTDSSQG